jgi:hypothetical protein
MVSLQPTDSSTLPKDRISASMLSFFDWSCANDNLLVFVPFTVGADVGPEGTVGACKFSILIFLISMLMVDGTLYFQPRLHQATKNALIAG